MDIRIMAERNAHAQARLLAAAESIGGKLGLLEPLESVRTARSRDPQLAMLFQREALADLLEAVNAALLEPAVVSAETNDPERDLSSDATPAAGATDAPAKKSERPAKKSGK